MRDAAAALNLATFYVSARAQKAPGVDSETTIDTFCCRYEQGDISFDSRGRNVAKEMGTIVILSRSVALARLADLKRGGAHFSDRPSPTRRGRPSVAGVGAAGRRRNRLPDRPACRAVGRGLRAPVERRPRRPCAVALPALVCRRRSRVMRRCVRVNRRRRAGSWTSCTRKSPGPRSAAARSARAPRTASAGNHQISNQSTVEPGIFGRKERTKSNFPVNHVSTSASTQRRDGARWGESTPSAI